MKIIIYLKIYLLNTVLTVICAHNDVTTPQFKETGLTSGIVGLCRLVLWIAFTVVKR